MSLVAIGYQPPEQIKAAASAVDIDTSVSSSLAPQTLSVDDLVATRVATNIAESADLPVASNVANLSQSIAAESVLAQNDANIVAKPQVVQASADTRQIQTYTAKAGDTVTDIAKQYHLSPQTIRWANDMESDAVEPGRKLKILPTDGILYTIQSGDSIQSLASRYKANVEQIRTYNDLELGGFKPGKKIIIPSGNLPADERPGYEAPVAPVAANAGIAYGTYGGGNGTGNNYAASVGNRYGFGQCTWYAYERRAELGRPVGSFWGNASTWAYYASAAGFRVDGSPAVGAIMQNGGGYGHVSIIESVNPGVSVTISEMNAYRFGGGFNRIGHGEISWSEAVSGMYQYIH
ncbi:MAG TPA: LysM peptidoglycan-binding domain-containing protein [Patescibacteria group bacterium]|jgi:surface antigen|nr:LysM peptidoglycan-binding domain-containing protein [Patescibacteria group bacterium]